MELIDKDAVIAEIEKCYNECLKRAKITDSDYWNAKADAYRNVLAILNDTLEVKEVDLEKEIDNVWNPHFNLGWDDNSLVSINHKSFESIAKHFYELGIKAKKGE